MTPTERIEAVLRGGRPDRVPFVPYDNLVPRGSFERELRDRGMGLCLRRSAISSGMQLRRRRPRILTARTGSVDAIATCASVFCRRLAAASSVGSLALAGNP